MALNHDHDPPHREAAGVERYSDPAGQSLADALRVSFRLLTLIMIGVVIAFLLTGIKTIEPNQVGIMTRFGKVVGLARQGLAYTWPYPVGDIEKINVEEQKVDIDDFWIFETPQEKLKPLSERTISSRGLNPIRENALLTGDHNLLHVRLTCKYTTADPLAYRQNVGKLDAGQDDLNAVIRSAAVKSAIIAAAHYTADGLQRTDRDRFASEVRGGAQDELDRLQCGIQLTQVLLTEATWPLRAMMVYTEAQNAVTEAEQRRNRARAEAENILNAAAGPAYKLLVGDPTRIHTMQGTDQAGQGLSQEDQVVADFGLIGLYRLQRDRAAQTGDFAPAEATLRRVDDLLMSSAVGGQASQIILEARGDSTRTVEQVKGRAQRFGELLSEFEKAPQLMLERLWAQARDEVLSAPQVEKFYLTMGPQKTVVQINRSPEVVRQMQQEEARLAAEARKQKMIEADR